MSLVYINMLRVSIRMTDKYLRMTVSTVRQIESQRKLYSSTGAQARNQQGGDQRDEHQ